MQTEAIRARLMGWYTSVRTRITRRRVIGSLLGVTLVGGTALVAEAAIRGKIGPAEARLPTALYARPVAWGSDDSGAAPTVIAALPGSAFEAREPVAFRDIPKALVDAVLAVEDQRFYEHSGFDVQRIGGAFLANVRAGGISQGGSTISQQLAKNLFLTADRTPVRKLREAALAAALELRYDKRTILMAYLNEIYLGQMDGRAVHGVGAAARGYFGKPVGRLSLAESAMLAGMIRAPNRTTPTRHPVDAKARRDLVLQLMAAQGRISPAAAEKAQRSRLTTRSRSTAVIDARHFRDAVLSTLPRGTPTRGAAIYTTLDTRLQGIAQRAVGRGLGRQNLRSAEAAMVAIDPQNGEVLALIGGRDYGASQFNRATVARRQPGSAFKPIVALAALERDHGNRPAFTLASVVEDAPLRLQSGRDAWEPSNYDGSFRGSVTVRQAMEQSLNVPFVRIGMAVGPARIASTAARLGIQAPMPEVPSLALGSAEVSLLELVRAYGVLAASGNLAETRFVLASSAQGATPMPVGASHVIRVADPAAAYLVTSALHGVVTRGTGTALQQRVATTGLAGKTGTSSDYRDAWFVAYTPTLVVGVWVGYDDGRSLQSTGATLALPMVAEFLDAALSGEEYDDFPVPDGITEAQVGSSDGEWSVFCGSSEVFLEGTEPEGHDCVELDLPSWGVPDAWRDAVQQRAERFLEGLLSRQSERRRPRR